MVQLIDGVKPCKLIMKELMDSMRTDIGMMMV